MIEQTCRLRIGDLKSRRPLQTQQPLIMSKRKISDLWKNDNDKRQELGNRPEHEQCLSYGASTSNSEMHLTSQCAMLCENEDKYIYKKY